MMWGFRVHLTFMLFRRGKSQTDGTDYQELDIVGK